MSDRLAKRIAHAGICSRRDAEKLIEAGRIAVNGKQITTPAFTVDNNDIVTLDGTPLQKPSHTPRVFLMHKPQGMICTAKDPQGRPTIFELIPAEWPRLVMVGRLDLNSEGLLLLTTHGEFAEELMHPRTGLEREYKVRFKGDLTNAVIADMGKGPTIEGIKYRPIHITQDDERKSANHWATVTIHEGKNREIRKVFANYGLQVNRLIRLRYGPFNLGDIPSRSVHEAPAKQVKALQAQLERKSKKN